MIKYKSLSFIALTGIILGTGAVFVSHSAEKTARIDAVLSETPEYHPKLVAIELEPTNQEDQDTTKKIYVAYSEVTIGQWQKCFDDGGCDYTPKMRANETEFHPVTKVSYFDVAQYLAWVSEKTGQQFRLPLESEWNYFSRDVISPPKKLFDDPRMAWAAEYVTFLERPTTSKTKPVGGHGTNKYGLVDLKGNVWEWTQTCWSTDYSTLETSEERITACGGIRIMQGEHRSYQSELIRDAKIGGCSVGSPPNNLGFRIVVDEIT
ncbi:formylglycine-generating enzyme family protein [Kiloniella antarctica]|uniref:Formylglycine-generating enzyme family protein n=1 Tax=Kiloniella antarctica TaxID=1550907 RepID=A0ABW5BRH4_9PROT